MASFRDTWARRVTSRNLALHHDDARSPQSATRFAVLEEVAQRSPDLIVVIDESGTVVYANPVALTLFGISLEQSLGTRAFKYVHPDDARRMASRFFSLVRIPGASMSNEVRVIAENGEIRELEIVTTNCLDHPDVAGIVVNGRDVSDRRSYVGELEVREKWHRTLAANSNHITLVLDRDGQTLYASPSNVNVSGYAANTRVGRSAFDLVHPDDLGSCRAMFLDAVRLAGTRPPSVFRFIAASGETRFLELVLSNHLDDLTIGGIVVNANDVTDSTNLSRALHTLTESNQILVRATDEQALLLDICETITNSGAYPLAWVGVAEYDDAHTVRPIVAAGRTAYLDEVRFSWGDDEFGRGTTGTAIRTGSMKVVDDVRLGNDHGPWLEPAQRHGLLTGCAFPLEVGGVVIGALTIYAGEPGAFASVELELLNELANDLAYGVGRLRDAARVAKHDQLMRESEQRFRVAFEQNMAPMILVGLDDRVIDANDAFIRLIGYSRDELVGRDSRHLTHPDDLGVAAERHRRAVNNDVGQERYAKRYVRKDGRVVAVEALRSPARDAHGKTLYFIISERDVTEERALTAQLSHQALHDPLTGLANRDLFEDRLVLAHSRVVREGALGAVLLLDLDDFKGVNDVHGHLVGDQLLVAVARRLEGVLRSTDTIGRLGGDEFLYLAEGLTSVADASQMAQRLLDIFATPFLIGDEQIEQHASIGVAVWEGASKEPAELIRDADVALYEAKSEGKGHHVIFTPRMHQQAISRFALVQELHHALENGELAMHYQPIVELATTEIVGFEALMRWRHPERGWVPPDVFIPLAEQSGLILELGAFALREAASAASSWERVVEPRRCPYVTVNLSAHQFHEPNLVALIDQALSTSGLDPRRLVVEITESVMLRDATDARNVLSRLQEHGVGFALDDFGTGYSSLSYLAAMHPRVIKIDQSFVRPSKASARNDALLETIISLGEKLDITMLAEGIETLENLERLRGLGCELGQGYLFSRPVANDEVIAMLARASSEWSELARATSNDSTDSYLR